MDSLETLISDATARARPVPARAAPAGSDGAAQETPESRRPWISREATGGVPAERTAIVRARPRHATLSPGAGDERAGAAPRHSRYRPIERIGSGGFGEVWRAEDVLLRREVALKRIPLAPCPSRSRASPQPHASERAGREALASARLSHPAIVALYEAYEDGEAFYLVSELVRGETLAQLIARGDLPDERALEIALALTRALAHAHARGVVHRDIKPQNVLVPARASSAHEAPAKLADFGGAQLAGEDALTRTGETLGTLAYMAPEQCEGREVGEAADVYSLALVVYETLTGVNPVRGPTPAATARRVGRPLPPLSAHRPDLPRALAGALDGALAVDPRRRTTLECLHEAFADALAEKKGIAAPRPATRMGGGLAGGPFRAARGASSAGAPPSPRAATEDEHRERAVEVARDPPVSSAPAYPTEAALAKEKEAEARPLAPPDNAPAPRRGLAAPRGVWLGGALALAVWQALAGRPGIALLVLAAVAPLLLAGPRPRAGWLTAALAPLLGAAGLAGAYPALAGQAGRWPRRAALGALGYWWLTLAEPVLASAPGGRLWLGPPAGTPPRAVWEGSLASAASHVLAPMLSVEALAGAVLWAAAAAVLPWLVRGRSAPADLLAALAWAAALLLATPRAGLAGVAGGAGAMVHPRGLVLGAVLGAGFAIAACALRGPVRARHP